MSPWHCRWAAAAALICVVSHPRADAGFTVEAWGLTCGIRDPNFNTRSATFSMVENPFTNSHQVALSGASAIGSYDIAWDVQSFDFDMTTSVTVPGTNVPTAGDFISACNGGMRVSTDIALLLDVDSSIAFSLPDGDREAIHSVSARIPGGAYLFVGGGSSVPIFGDPRTGVLAAHGTSVLFPANGTYVINYEVELVSLVPSNPSVLSHADGYINLHLSVPEPATLAMLSIAALAFHRRLPLRRPGTSRAVPRKGTLRARRAAD